MTALLEQLRELIKTTVLGRECPVCFERHHNLAAHHYVDHAGGSG